MKANYLFIDGSALTAQIRLLWKLQPLFRNRRLDVCKFVNYFFRNLDHLDLDEYKRATFYFPVGDENTIGDYLIIPDHQVPGAVTDIHIKHCGQKLKKSAKFQKWVDENVPEQWEDRFTKSEKGVDIEICCDALKIASRSGIDRLVLLTNDYDFVPFCRTIKEFGANISIIHLSNVVKGNVLLLREVDSYNVVLENDLSNMFGPVVHDVETQELAVTEESTSVDLKPHAPPSDLDVNDGSDLVVTAEDDEIDEGGGENKKRIGPIDT